MSKKPREKSARRFSLSKIRSRFSLSIQLLFLTFIVSAIGWGIIDYIQTRSLEKIFRDRLAATLSEQAQKDRAQFDNHVKKHMQAVRIYATTEFFEHYTGIDTFSEEPPTATKYFHGELPPWLPTAGIMRSLIYPRYAILIDGQGRAREVYIGWHEDPPSVLLNPSYYLQQLSHNQSYLVSLEGKPFLVTASDTHFKNGEVRATLMIAEPLDNEFLTGAEGFESKEIVALLSGRDAVVTASNRPDLLAPGTPLEAIEKDYMVTGSSFFDYGSSELLLQLTSFISYRDYEALYTSIMGTERRLRSYMALMLTTFFIILMLGIVYRIKMLGRDVRELSQWELGIDLESDIKGDELFVLERLFYRLREEINRHRSMVSSKLEELEESNEFLNMEVQHRKLTEEMLQDYMETLEQKVEDRTRELAYKASEAEMANRAKSDFLANVSH
ncbi:MAG: hypothetical protein OEV64_03015, partial [Desulfobulbaceae bacterium]|nr:hypothetical protein [Desulfobulbaceae bacterium]